MQLGENSSYLALGTRAPVYGTDGRLIGVVKKVECDRRNDIFDGLVLSTPTGQRYLRGEQVKAVYESAVEATISSVEALDLSRGPTMATLASEGIVGSPVTWGELRRWLISKIGLGRVDDPRLKEADERLARRHRALQIARENPELAREAGIGRPDIRGAFHAEVVDLNNAGAGALAGLPGINLRLAGRIISVRERVNGFSSLEDFGLVLDIDGATIEVLRGLVVFLPRHPETGPSDPDIDDVSPTPA